MLDTSKIREEVKGLTLDTRKWHAKREYRDLDRNGFIELMKLKYEYLTTNSNTLFERCIQGDLNIQQLEYMLDMVERVLICYLISIIIFQFFILLIYLSILFLFYFKFYYFIII